MRCFTPQIAALSLESPNFFERPFQVLYLSLGLLLLEAEVLIHALLDRTTAKRRPGLSGTDECLGRNLGVGFRIRIEYENNAAVKFSQLARDLAQIIPLQPALQPVRRGRCLTRRFGERFTRNMPQTLLESGEQRRNMIQEFCTG